jgi:hypothetical protein
VWGVTIGGAVLQNELSKRLPPALLAKISGPTDLAYALIPTIKTFEEPLRTEVRVAFADSLRVVWEVIAGIGALGLVVSLLMKALPLPGGRTVAHKTGDVEGNSDDEK